MRRNGLYEDIFQERKQEIKYLGDSDIIYEKVTTDKKQDALGGTIFDAVLTNNDLIFDKKTEILFHNFDQLKRPRHERLFQFLLDSFNCLAFFFPEIFIRTKGTFIKTEKIIEDKDKMRYKDLFYYFTEKSLLKQTRVGRYKDPINIFSKRDMLERKLLVDAKYMDKNYDQYTAIYLNENIPIIKDANKIMGSYYKEFLLYENKIIRIETKKLVKINLGDLFWVSTRPKVGEIESTTIGKIINVIKNMEE
jgi:hypothetical protein